MEVRQLQVHRGKKDEALLFMLAPCFCFDSRQASRLNTCLLGIVLALDTTQSTLRFIISIMYRHILDIFINSVFFPYNK